MSNETQKKTINIALIGGDYFARLGIASLLLKTNRHFKVHDFGNQYEILEKNILEMSIKVVFISGGSSYNIGFEKLRLIREIKTKKPDIIFCMYSKPACSLLWLQGDIDFYISLMDPIYYWRTFLFKIFNYDLHTKKNIFSLKLTQQEWKVLCDLKNGKSINQISRNESITYNRVSSIKNSAIKKLGLRNKVELLLFLTS
ncbi:helix-turn-helix transcriptional regulator [Klebsiella aerogenes]|nr:helix-turn-helix transcriptional regulator [Klebsiella aerogenes]ELA2606820.1 helix-turn-helix transcriptional regulator [Klebsiella aerogenes]EMC9823462.1 helix-turn-helix transcriptional regulator [Klebsiella aerogenes]HEO1674995.1 helix-turn-helix transcriptional regulator [Klebsiella aerogenes]